MFTLSGMLTIRDWFFQTFPSYLSSRQSKSCCFCFDCHKLQTFRSSRILQNPHCHNADATIALVVLAHFKAPKRLFNGCLHQIRKTITEFHIKFIAPHSSSHRSRRSSRLLFTRDCNIFLLFCLFTFGILMFAVSRRKAKCDLMDFCFTTNNHRQSRSFSAGCSSFSSWLDFLSIALLRLGSKVFWFQIKKNIYIDS